LLELGRGLVRSIGAAHQRTHAGVDDAIDRDAQFLEQRDHTDVCRALGAAGGGVVLASVD
jgi:hypothetical protein